MIEYIKHDCMWSGSCDRKCQGKMESLLSKSSFSNDNLNELYFNLCGNQDSIDLLDSLDSEDFSDLLINNLSSNQLNMNCQQQQYNNYYQCQPNYNQTNQQLKQSSNLTININQIQQTANHSNQNLTSSITNNNLTKFDTTNNHQKQFDTSSLLGSSLNNELLLNSDSANIILTQHNQQVDNSQLINNTTTSNQLNYNQTSLNTNLNNLNNTDLVNCSNDNSTLDNSINSTNVHLTNTHNNQIATINNSNFNQHYHQILSNTNNMVSNYTFDNTLIDTTFSCTNVNDSAGSSNNSECSSSVLLERTDYDTDDIEDDLDLLEDIIEEECDDSNINCYSIANSLESSSDVEMIASPISDSLINDHSYGASSIDLLTSNHQTIPLTTNTTITNVNQHHHSNYQSLINIQNQTTTRSLIRNNHDSTSTTKVSKRRQLANLNNNQITTRKNLHRHSGTSLLMKDKQSAASKIKKVMDTDRRKEHNESERMRRDVLKNAFLNLRNKCPKLQNSNKKSSRIQILNEATNFIKFMNKEQKNLELEKQQESNRYKELLAKLSKLENQ